MIWFLAACLSSLADGVLTYIGVSRWGLGIEGNPVVRSFMYHYGVIPGLMITRILAIAIFAFCWRGGHDGALIALTGLFVLLAVIPWCYILLRWS